MSSTQCHFSYWSLLSVWYSPYTHMNKKKEDSYSYGYDKNHAINSFAHHRLYTFFLPAKGEQVLAGRLIPCIKKDPTLVRVFYILFTRGPVRGDLLTMPFYQPIAGATSATSVISAAAKSRGKL